MKLEGFEGFDVRGIVITEEDIQRAKKHIREQLHDYRRFERRAKKVLMRLLKQYQGHELDGIRVMACEFFLPDHPYARGGRYTIEGTVKDNQKIYRSCFVFDKGHVSLECVNTHKAGEYNPVACEEFRQRGVCRHLIALAKAVARTGHKKMAVEI